MIKYSLLPYARNTAPIEFYQVFIAAKTKLGLPFSEKTDFDEILYFNQI